MTREEFIKTYKVDGQILIQHADYKERDGSPMMQYIPVATLSTMQKVGWFLIPNVPTPPEALEPEIKETEEKEIEQLPVKRGRKPKEV